MGELVGRIDPRPQSAAERSSERAATTRRLLLEAAREVFAVAGFAEANISDVVSRAGASVGSLYHHFGGKADLYLALFEDYQARQEERAAQAVRAARESGEEHPVRLFIAGARAYLDGCWEERDLARIFLQGGGPPGFELVARRRYRDWVRHNQRLLRAEDEPFDDALVLVLTTVAAEAGREVAVCEDEPRATKLADEVLALIARIARPPS